MRPTSRHVHALIVLMVLLVAPCARAGITLKIEGVDDSLRTAVASAVRMSQYAHRAVTAAQVRRLAATAPEEARRALQPYGYYEATASLKLASKGADWEATLRVNPGPPVIVRSVAIRLPDAVRTLPDVARALKRFQPRTGQRLDDGQYTASRDALGNALEADGYLHARMTVHRVEVTRASRSAAVHLAWDAGRRYRFGDIRFHGSQFRDGFLDRYLPFKGGDFYSQSQLLALQQALNGSDYFSVVNVQPDVAHPHDGKVDVDVQLKPAKRSVYTGGPFIGTDTGLGMRLGLQRRWVNKRGNSWDNQLVIAQRLKMLSTLYRIPMPGPHQRNLDLGANYRQATTDSSRSRTLEVVAAESELWHGWLRTIGLHALSGTFTVGASGVSSPSTPGIERGHSTLLYPEISLVKKQADNPDFVRHGWMLSLTARSTMGMVLSDTRFSQLVAEAKWIQAFAGSNRVILRGSAGTTVVGNFDALPPQLRFFAGGDRSVRGYGYDSIGPRNSYDRVIGGRNLLVASATVEHYFTRNWGMAAFVDTGNAFNGTTYYPRIGTGLGLRWRSPVGMIRLDVGVPVHDAHAHGVELHLVIGPDL